MSELLDIKKRFEELQNKYQAYLPKVDPDLIHDILTRQQENPQVTPMYMLEVFTRSGIDSQAARNYIFEKTVMVAAVYDHGTHYVTNQKVTLEILKEISNSEDVLEVAGEYTGGIGGGVPRMNMQVTDIRMTIIHPLHRNNSDKLRNIYHQLKKT